MYQLLLLAFLCTGVAIQLKDAQALRDALFGHPGFKWDTPDQLSKWLIETEQKYGGLATNIPCMRGFDDPEAKKFNYLCQGGDRMSPSHHNYAPCYARYIDANHKLWEESQHSLVAHVAHVDVAEIGILKGSGLAIWSELFPQFGLHGFDIDLTNINENMANLTAKGAFANGKPKLHVFNQMSNNTALIQNITADMQYVFVIDDGLHTKDALLQTFKTFKPHLADNAVYIMEDVHCHENLKTHDLSKKLEACKRNSTDYLRQIGPGYKLEVCPESPIFWALTKDNSG